MREKHMARKQVAAALYGNTLHELFVIRPEARHNDDDLGIFRHDETSIKRI